MRKAAAVSIDPGLHAEAERRAKTLHMTFSQYVKQLIRMDLAEGNGPLSIVAEQSGSGNTLNQKTSFRSTSGVSPSAEVTKYPKPGRAKKVKK